MTGGALDAGSQGDFQYTRGLYVWEVCQAAVPDYKTKEVALNLNKTLVRLQLCIMPISDHIWEGGEDPRPSRKKDKRTRCEEFHLEKLEPGIFSVKIVCWYTSIKSLQISIKTFIVFTVRVFHPHKLSHYFLRWLNKRLQYYADYEECWQQLQHFPVKLYTRRNPVVTMRIVSGP